MQQITVERVEDLKRMSEPVCDPLEAYAVSPTYSLCQSAGQLAMLEITLPSITGERVRIYTEDAYTYSSPAEICVFCGERGMGKVKQPPGCTKEFSEGEHFRDLSIRAICRLSCKRDGERYLQIPWEPVSVVRSLLTANLLDIDRFGCMQDARDAKSPQVVQTGVKFLLSLHSRIAAADPPTNLDPLRYMRKERPTLEPNLDFDFFQLAPHCKIE